MNCPKILFHMNNCTDPVGPVTFVKRILNENGHEEKFAKRALNFVSFLVLGFNISDIFYKMQIIS